MPSLPSPEPTVSCFDDLDFFNDLENEFPAIVYNDAQTSKLDDLDYFKDFENEFPAIVYNDAQTSKSDLSTEPILNPQHIDEFNLKDETSLSECDEEEQNVLNFNDQFPFNVIYPNDSKSDKDNDNDKVDIEHSSGDLSVKPLPDVINTDVGAYAHGSNKLLETSINTAYPGVWILRIDFLYSFRVLYKVEDIATCPIEYVKFWNDWGVDRYGNANLDSVMSDSDESGVTHTEVSSPFEDLSDIGSPRADDHELLELPYMPEDPYYQSKSQPPSPDYVPGPEHADDEIIAEDQPYAEDASPTAQSPDYVPDTDPEADPEEDDDEDPEEDPIDYPADGGDDGDDEMDIDEDDDMDIDADEEDEDDEMDVEVDEEAEEEHSAPAYPVVVALPATAPSAEETEPFETDESAATPPPPPCIFV
ncbi:hypothetical protein Tco_0315943 [Tanacetum coccineum]